MTISNRTNTREVIFHMYVIAKAYSGVMKVDIGDVLRRVKYTEDKDVQTIRTPLRVLREGLGNCVDLSVLVAAYLYRQGVPFCFVTCVYPGTAHVYIIETPGVHGKGPRPGLAWEPTAYVRDRGDLHLIVPGGRKKKIWKLEEFD